MPFFSIIKNLLKGLDIEDTLKDIEALEESERYEFIILKMKHVNEQS